MVILAFISNISLELNMNCGWHFWNACLTRSASLWLSRQQLIDSNLFIKVNLIPAASIVVVINGLYDQIPPRRIKTICTFKCIDILSRVLRFMEFRLNRLGKSEIVLNEAGLCSKSSYLMVAAHISAFALFSRVGGWVDY